MYRSEDQGGLAVEAVAAGFSLTEAAELAGCSRTAVVNWAKAAGVAPPPRKKAVYLPFDRKMELVAQPAGGRGAGRRPSPPRPASPPLPSPAGAGELREEGALSLMTDSDIAARAPEPREAPSRSSRSFGPAARRSWSCATPSSRGRSTY